MKKLIAISIFSMLAMMPLSAQRGRGMGMGMARSGGGMQSGMNCMRQNRADCPNKPAQCPRQGGQKAQPPAAAEPQPKK